MIDSLTEDIEKKVNKFVAGLPAVERELYSSILTEIKEFSLYSDGTIKNNLENIKRLGRIKRQMDSIVLNDAYLKDVSDFIGAYSSVEKTMNVYFSKLSSDFTPKKVLEEVKKQAINDAVEMLTENGISTNISQPLRDLIKTNVTSGGSYAQLTEQLRESILGTPDADGSLTKYAKTYATDAVNGYSGTYMKMVTDDLGLSWYRYVGSLIKTSRPFCVAMVKKSYVHKSEFTEILKGNIDGVKVSLSGVKKETTPENFQELRGGFSCGHQLIPISEESVPEEIKNKLKSKATTEEGAPTEQQSESSAYDAAALSQNKGWQRAQRNLDSEPQYSKVHENLSHDEKTAIYGYTSDQYIGLNRYLRTGKVSDSVSYNKEYFDNYASVLNNSLDKIDSNFEGIVYRGTQLTEQDIAVYKKALKNNKEVTHRFFTSTSKVDGGDFSGNTKYLIHSKTGKDIDSLSRHVGEENEVLFKAGTKFKVRRIEEQKNGWFIEMEEL